MLKVDDYERIRRAHFIHGWSQREIARRYGHSRKTVRKALVHSEPPGYRRTLPKTNPVLEPFLCLIKGWLKEDKNRPKKQRHTAKRIQERLSEEYGFKGSYSAVQRFVRHLKSTQGEVFLTLQFDPGQEAQMDWGDGWCMEKGKQTKYILFCMRLNYSQVCFVRAYRRQNMVALLDGHQRAFAFFSGVPKRIAYDNMRTAVVKVGRGRERTLTKDFMRLRSHFLFDSRFCNIASGNEKGHVENLVKWAQRRMLTPLPDVQSLEQLNQHLQRQCLEDLTRINKRLKTTRQLLLKEERLAMLPLPEQPFEACTRLSTIGHKTATVRFDKNDYSVPVAFAHHPLLVKGFVDTVQVSFEGSRIATHKRDYNDGQWILDPYHYIPLLEKKPGGLLDGRAFRGEPFGPDMNRLRDEMEHRYGGEGTRRYIQVLLLFARFPEHRVKEAVRTCLERQAYSADAVQGVLNYIPPKQIGCLDLSQRPHLVLRSDGSRPLNIYNALLNKEAT